jgi:hypothetical protein
VKRLPLYAFAHARSGDKGDASNVGIAAYDDAGFAILRGALTPERVARHFAGIVRGPVVRHELPNLRALNFVLNGALGGGGSASLRTDAQGKTHALALLRMVVEVPEDYAPPRVGTRGAVWPGGEIAPGG